MTPPIVAPELVELMEDGAMTVLKAVPFSGLTRTALYGYMGQGRLPYVDGGKQRLIPRRALVRLLAELLAESESRAGSSPQLAPGNTPEHTPHPKSRRLTA